MTLASSTTSAEEAKRGEIWNVNLDPTVGDEIQKERPGVIVSSDGLGSLSIRLIVPIRKWKPSHVKNIWHVPIKPSISNGLKKKSTADVLQAKCVSTKRLTQKMGCVSAEIMAEIAAALAAITEYA